MNTTRREMIGKAVRWTFLGTVAASLAEGLGGVDPKTGRCNCLFCQAERAFSSNPSPVGTHDVQRQEAGKTKPT